MTQLLLFGISTAAVWALADIFIAKATKTIRPVFAAALVNVLGALLFAIYYASFVRDGIDADVAGWAYALGGGLFIALASMFFFIALSKGPVGISSAISSTYPAGTLALATLVFGAAIDGQQGFGISMVIVGVAVASGLFKRDKVKKKRGLSGPVVALFAAAAWAVGYALLAESVARLGWQAATLLQMAAIAVVYAVLSFTTRKTNGITSYTLRMCARDKFIIGAALTQLAGGLLLNIGLEHDTTGGSVIVALSSCYPILTVMLAYVYLSERVPLSSLLGGLLGVVGVVVLSVA